MGVILSRRHLMLGLMAGTTGCATTLRQSPYWGSIAAVIEGAKDNPLINRGTSDRIPYANIVAWFEGAPHAILILGTADGDGTLNWYGADHKSISTRGPIITRVVGFEVELRDARFESNWPTDIRSMLGGQYERTMSYVAERPREIRLKSSFKSQGNQQIIILGNEYRVDEIHERVSSDGQYRFTNRYWVDSANGFCWKSIQTAIPTLPPLNIEILKPYRPA